MAGGSVWIDAGLLSIDEVFSPVQMVLDDEMIGALERFTHAFQVTEETIGLQEILEAGPGGHYLDKQHTARYFRQEHWNPTVWSRRMLRPWMEAGHKLDADVAREMVMAVQEQVRQGALAPEGMSETLERAVLGIIERAKTELV
jgi:trimethylamine--corrinoid protein Co-methyltransferase